MQSGLTQETKCTKESTHTHTHARMKPLFVAAAFVGLVLLSVLCAWLIWATRPDGSAKTAIVVLGVTGTGVDAFRQASSSEEFKESHVGDVTQAYSLVLDGASGIYLPPDSVAVDLLSLEMLQEGGGSVTVTPGLAASKASKRLALGREGALLSGSIKLDSDVGDSLLLSRLVLRARHIDLGIHSLLGQDRAIRVWCADDPASGALRGDKQLVGSSIRPHWYDVDRDLLTETRPAHPATIPAVRDARLAPGQVAYPIHILLTEPATAVVRRDSSPVLAVGFDLQGSVLLRLNGVSDPSSVTGAGDALYRATLFQEDVHLDYARGALAQPRD